MAQLVMPFAQRADYSAESFLPTAGSAAARAALDGFLRGVVCLWGATGSGKTHLLRIWAARVDAATQAEDAGDFLAVDDVENMDRLAQEKLFFWLNGRGKTGALLVTSRRPVVEVESLLPDIRSRLSLGRGVEMLPPTDDELAGLCLKWAKERQMALNGEVVAYVLARAERSVPALKGIIEALDRLSLEEKRAVTVPLAKKVLGF